jgi:DNA-binding transcriptional MerR regulator
MKASRHELIVLRPRVELFRLEDVAVRTGLHPDVIRRFIELDLIQPAEESSYTETLLTTETVHRIRVIQRLRCDLGINLQGIAVILDLLDRVK